MGVGNDFKIHNNVYKTRPHSVVNSHRGKPGPKTRTKLDLKKNPRSPSSPVVPHIKQSIMQNNFSGWPNWENVAFAGSG